jgi:hypothetical protein
MNKTVSHPANLSFRHIIAAAMMALYLTIIFSPLAPFATHSTDAAPMAIRECSGDCNLCGCSPESRAANTCCCSKKRQQQAHIHEDVEADEPECCKKERADKKTVIACGCPCGNGKQDALSASGISELLPFHFTEQFSIPHRYTTFSNLTKRLTSRHVNPPDPPPKLSFCS